MDALFSNSSTHTGDTPLRNAHRPSNVEEIRAILHQAKLQKTPIYIHRDSGQQGLHLVLTRMNKILETDTANLVAGVEPGVRLGDLSDALIEHRLRFVPAATPFLHEKTVGQFFYEGCSNIASLKYGPAKHFLMGADILLPDGKLIKTGGKTVKNVTGYDLTRFMNGPYANLGIPVKFLLKLLPEPEAKRLIIARILVHNGIEVTLPIDQYCCGTPAFTSGDFPVGRYLAERNIDALSKQPLDAVITGCPSCGLALKHEYGHIIDDPRLKEKWTEIATKVHDITQFLVEIGHREDFHEVKLKLTYHDPCHLVRGMGVSQEPRQMLKAIPGIDFVEMAHADECCGAGGTFSLSYYDISRQINDKKLDAAQDTNAQVLVTGCSVCRMHIDDGLSRRQGTIKVRHTAEILAAAYRIPGKEVIS